MFQITRRKFFALLASGTAAAIGSLLYFRSSLHSDRKSFLERSRRTTSPLGEETLKILIAMAEALTGRSTLQGDYAGYYHWRAQNLQGYKTRYERFADLLQARSIAATKRNFGDNPMNVRLEIVNSFRPAFQKSKSETGLRTFEKYIIQETLHLFARTDAFLALGYDSFPGQARGFETYRKLPA
jgi:hypothetical protein